MLYIYISYVYNIYIYIHVVRFRERVSALCMHLKGEQYYLYIQIYTTLYVHIICIYITPHTEEIRVKIFGSPDYTVSPYNQGTPVFFRENLFKFLGTPVKTCLKVTGTPVKTGLKFWQS